MAPADHWFSSHYAVTLVRNKNSNISREVTQCGKSDFPYHKELLLKEQILSFKRSSYFETGGGVIEENRFLIQ